MYLFNFNGIFNIFPKLGTIHLWLRLGNKGIGQVNSLYLVNLIVKLCDFEPLLLLIKKKGITMVNDLRKYFSAFIIRIFELFKYEKIF